MQLRVRRERHSCLPAIASTIAESGEGFVSKALSTTPDDHLAGLLKKASCGDRSVLPEMRRVFDDSPELWQFLGDLGRHAKTVWIDPGQRRGFNAP